VLHPRYLIKRAWLVVVFALLCATGGILTDPKQFRIVSDFVRVHKPSVSTLIAAVIAAFAVSFVLAKLTLEPRYATSGQSTAAALLFVFIYGAASLAGFWVRLRFLPDPGSQGAAVGMADLLIAEIVLCVVGTAFGVAYNTAFVQKIDYTKFRTEVRNVVASIGAMETTFLERGYLTAEDAEVLQRNCNAAHNTAVELVKIELPAYGAMIERRYVQPLEKLARAASGKEVSDAPESFLRACGVIDDDSEEELRNAFRRLKSGT
jgi:hypothetical protein